MLQMFSTLSLYRLSGGFLQISIHSHTLGVKLKAVILKQTKEMMCVKISARIKKGGEGGIAD